MRCIASGLDRLSATCAFTHMTIKLKETVVGPKPVRMHRKKNVPRVGFAITTENLTIQNYIISPLSSVFRADKIEKIRLTFIGVTFTPASRHAE